MKITHNKVGQNINTLDTGKADKAGKAQSAIGGATSPGVDALKELGEGNSASKVNLSPRAQEMKRIKELATAAPDVNEEKVARLQKLIDDGKYKVDAKEIADKMVDESLNWS